MTDIPAEIQKQIDDLKAAKEQLTAKLESVKEEAIRNRQGKQDARKREFVLKEVVKKNNIAFDIDSFDLGGIQVDNNGEVTGQVPYEPTRNPPPGSGMPPSSGNAGGGMTLETVKGLNRSEITKENWGEVMNALKNANNTPKE